MLGRAAPPGSRLYVVAVILVAAPLVLPVFPRGTPVFGLLVPVVVAALPLAWRRTRRWPTALMASAASRVLLPLGLPTLSYLPGGVVMSLAAARGYLGGRDPKKAHTG